MNKTMTVTTRLPGLAPNRMPALAAVVGLLALACGCSAVNQLYVHTGYDAQNANAVKRIAIVSWTAPKSTPVPETASLGHMVSTIANDRIGLKMDYLVYHTGVLNRGWSDHCAPTPGGEASEDAGGPSPKPMEGVLSIRILRLAPGTEANTVDLRLAAALHRCRDGALVWRAEAAGRYASDNPDLESMAASYKKTYPALDGGLAPALFLGLRDILDTLPNPVLSDDEIMEKIELG